MEDALEEIDREIVLLEIYKQIQFVHVKTEKRRLIQLFIKLAVITQ